MTRADSNMSAGHAHGSRATLSVTKTGVHATVADAGKVVGALGVQLAFTLHNKNVINIDVLNGHIIKYKIVLIFRLSIFLQKSMFRHIEFYKQFNLQNTVSVISYLSRYLCLFLKHDATSAVLKCPDKINDCNKINKEKSYIKII